VGEAINLLNKAHIKVAVVTNQSAVGRGQLSVEGLEEIHAAIQDHLSQEKAWIDAFFYCPDIPERATERRKPGSGMLKEALELFNACPQETPLIGDDIRDLKAAATIGCPRHLVQTGKGEAILKQGLPLEVLPVCVHKDLLAAVQFLLK